nr:hypothetical protein [Moraxella sp. CTOTU48841]
MAIQMVKVGESENDGTGDPARTCFTKINQNFADNANAASRLVGTATGNVIEVGAYNIGVPINQITLTNSNVDVSPSQLASWYETWNAVHFKNADWAGTGEPHWTQLLVGRFANKGVMVRAAYNGAIATYKLYGDHNTTTDSNGFIKAASPIVKLFADKIELNDEAQQQNITFEKLGVGDYLVKGSTGFAQEGWYIEMPKDANGNVLVAVVYEQLANNDISVKTYAKMFDEETGDIVANIAKPRDIPSTRWIDLRLQALPQSDIEPFATEENTVTTNAE